MVRDSETPSLLTVSEHQHAGKGIKGDEDITQYWDNKLRSMITPLQGITNARGHLKVY